MKQNRTIAQICSEYSVGATQVFAWKKQLLEGVTGVFENEPRSSSRSEEAITDPLFKEIGRLQVENAFLKKKGSVARTTIYSKTGLKKRGFIWIENQQNWFLRQNLLF